MWTSYPSKIEKGKTRKKILQKNKKSHFYLQKIILKNKKLSHHGQPACATWHTWLATFLPRHNVCEKYFIFELED